MSDDRRHEAVPRPVNPNAARDILVLSTGVIVVAMLLIVYLLITT